MTVGLMHAATMPGVYLNQTGFQTIDNNVKIELLPSGNRYSIADVVLRYRPLGNMDFKQIHMSSNGFKYEAEIDIKELKSGSFEYEFALTDRNGETYLYSSNDAGDLPFRFNIMQEADDTIAESDKVQAVIISPLEDETVSEEDFIGVISILSMPPNFAIARTKIFIDGIDYTGDGNIGERVITFTPSTLPPGVHDILIQFYAQDGSLLNKMEWEFTLLRTSSDATTTRARLNGRFYVNNQFKKTGITDSLPDGSYRQNYMRGGADITGQLGFIDYGGRLFFSSEEADIYQPINIYTAFLKMNLGTSSYLRVSGIDNYPNYNRLVVKDKRIRGLEGNVKLGWLEFSAAMGETRRSIAGQVRPDTLVTDSLGNAAENAFGYTYKRNAFAGRFGLGSPNGLLLGLSFYKSKDDENTLELDDATPGAKITIGGTKPRENMVVGTDITLRLFKRKFEIYGLGAASLTNLDITGGSIPLDTLKKYQEGLDDSFDQIYDLATKVMTVNMGLVTDPGLSFETGVKMRFWNNFFQAKFETANQQYASYGLQYYRSDFDAIRISDGLTLLSNTLAVNAGYDIVTYNKSLETAIKNKQLNVSVGYNPGPHFPSISFNYLNVDRNNVNEGAAVPIEENFKTYSVSAGYLLSLLGVKNNLNFTLSQSQRDDPNSTVANSTANVLNVTVRSLFDFPLRTRFSFDKNLTDTGDDTNFYNSTFTSFTVGADYVLERFFLNWDFQIGGYGKFGNLNDESTLYGKADLVRNLFNGSVVLDMKGLGIINSGIDYYKYKDDVENSADFIWTTRYSINF